MKSKTAQARAIWYAEQSKLRKKQFFTMIDYGLKLDFALSGYKYPSCYLQSRGFNPYTLEYIGIHGCRKTLVKISKQIRASMGMTIPEFEEYIRNY